MEKEEMKIDPTIVDFLGRELALKGKPRKITIAEECDNSIITGKIIHSRVLLQPNIYQPYPCLVYHMKEVWTSNGEPRKEFKAVFVGKAAELVDSLDLGLKDFLAFYNVKFAEDFTSSEKKNLYRKFIVVGNPPYPNKPESVYYKRKSTVGEFTMLTDQTVHQNLVIADSCALDIASSRCTSEHVNTRDAPEAEATTSRNTVDASSSKHKTGQPKEAFQYKKPNGITKWVKPAMCSGESSDKSLMESVVPNVPELNVYTYQKLDQLTTHGMRAVNLYAVITEIVKEPVLNAAKKKYHTIVKVIDETNPDGFIIHIYYKKEETPPVLKKYFIARFSGLKVEEFHGRRLDGRVFNSSQVVTFDKDDINIIYKQTKFTIPDSERKRVEYLREWKQEHSREITPLKLIELKRQTINVRGEVVEVKCFDESKVIVLRIRDGTPCKVPVCRLNLELDNYMKILSNITYSSNCKEIDICIAEPEENFRTLQVGQKIVLYNVISSIDSKIIKTIPTVQYLKFQLIGKSKNLKELNSLPNTSSVKTTMTNEVDTVSDTNAIGSDVSPVLCPEVNREKKRKLFLEKAFIEEVEDDDAEDSNVCQAPPNVVEKSSLPPVPKSTPPLSNPSPSPLTKSSETNTSNKEDNNETEINSNGKSVEVGTRKRKSSSESVESSSEEEDAGSTANNLNHISNTKRSKFEVSARKRKSVSESVELSSEEVDGGNKSTANNLNRISNTKISKLADVVLRLTQNREKLVKEKCAEQMKGCDPIVLIPKLNGVQMKMFPEQMTHKMKPCEDIIVNGDADEKNEDNCSIDYRTVWPPLNEDPFSIKVRLVSTHPVINAYISDLEIMSIISSYCAECCRFCPYDHVKWVKPEDENSVATCPYCKKEEGKIRETSFLLMVGLIMQDEKGDIMEAVLLGEYAEKFFGCDVRELCSSNRLGQKKRIINLIDSHLTRANKKQCKSLIVQITPFLDNPRYKYHITGITSID